MHNMDSTDDMDEVCRVGPLWPLREGERRRSARMGQARITLDAVFHQARK